MRPFLALLVALAAACHSPTAPDDNLASQPHGRLAGTVTIAPGPAQPADYKQRKILVYNEAKTTLLHTVDIDSQGFYVIDLVPAKYTVDFKGIGADTSSDLPKTIEIHANVVTTLNVRIRTSPES